MLTILLPYQKTVLRAWCSCVTSGWMTTVWQKFPSTRSAISPLCRR